MPRNVMTSKSKARGCLKVLVVLLGGSVIAGAQTHPGERLSLPSSGSQKYWLAVNEFAEHAIHFAYAKRFVQLHERVLSDRQCQQYSRIAADYADQLAAVKQTGLSAQRGFWKDVREYSIRMIGQPGVPIPIHQTSNYWITTGSEADDRDLRRTVAVEIDEASSQLIRTGEYSPSPLTVECRNADQEQTAKSQP